MFVVRNLGLVLVRRRFSWRHFEDVNAFEPFIGEILQSYWHPFPLLNIIFYNLLYFMHINRSLHLHFHLPLPNFLLMAYTKLFDNYRQQTQIIWLLANRLIVPLFQMVVKIVKEVFFIEVFHKMSECFLIFCYCLTTKQKWVKKKFLVFMQKIKNFSPFSNELLYLIWTWLQFQNHLMSKLL